MLEAPQPFPGLRRQKRKKTHKIRIHHEKYLDIFLIRSQYIESLISGVAVIRSTTETTHLKTLINIYNCMRKLITKTFARHIKSGQPLWQPKCKEELILENLPTNCASAERETFPLEWNLFHTELKVVDEYCKRSNSVYPCLPQRVIQTMHYIAISWSGTTHLKTEPNQIQAKMQQKGNDLREVERGQFLDDLRPNLPEKDEPLVPKPIG